MFGVFAFLQCEETIEGTLKSLDGLLLLLG